MEISDKERIKMLEKLVELKDQKIEAKEEVISNLLTYIYKQEFTEKESK